VIYDSYHNALGGTDNLAISDTVGAWDQNDGEKWVQPISLKSY